MTYKRSEYKKSTRNGAAWRQQQPVVFACEGCGTTLKEGKPLCRGCRRRGNERRQAAYARVEELRQALAVTTRVCSSCQHERPVADFLSERRVSTKRPSKMARRLDALMARSSVTCRHCKNNERFVRHRRRHPETAREYASRRRVRTSQCAHPSCLALGVFPLVKMLHPQPICYLCDEPLRWSSRRGEDGAVQLDHVHPLSRGGQHCAENVLPACQACNLVKGSRLLADIRPDLAHLDACCYVTNEVADPVVEVAS